MSVVFGVLLLVLVGGGLSPFPATADVFCDNLKQVAATLPKNTSSSPVLFATTAFGQAPDVVYALALCRGDVVNSSACGECVAEAFDKIQRSLPSQQQCYQAAVYYGDFCELAYSLEDILTGDGGVSTFVRWNTNSWGSSGNWSVNNITGDADDVILTVGRLRDLLVRTVRAASTATPRRFATGVMDSPKVFYTLAQCTPDLSAGNCFACLNNLLGMLNSTTALRNGARIYSVRCFFRYENYSFYDSQPIVHLGQPSAPTPAPIPDTTGVNRKSKFTWLHLCRYSFSSKL
jgi:hypothetical protein